MSKKLTFQEIILTLQQYWNDQGCMLMQAYDNEKGAGTMSPYTFLRAIGPEPWNDMGFDIEVDERLLHQMAEEASPFYPSLKDAMISGERVGIRAYTSDFSPFFGQVPELEGIYAASGLGSSGLTTGPIIGIIWLKCFKGEVEY